jgi:hypothetical protein
MNGKSTGNNLIFAHEDYEAQDNHIIRYLETLINLDIYTAYKII